MKKLIFCIGIIILIVTVNVNGQTKLKTNVEKLTDLTKVENVSRVQVDAAGKVRVLVVIDEKHAVEGKWQDVPTTKDISNFRDKIMIQEATSKAEIKTKEDLKNLEEQRKAEGKCPTCGQILPKEKEEVK